MTDKIKATGSQVFSFVHSDLKHFHDEIYARLLKSLIDREKPDMVICSATFYGKALAGRLAALCGGALASDCTGLTVKDGVATALRPAYGGNVFLKIQNNREKPFFITLRPKAFPEAKDDGDGNVIARFDGYMTPRQLLSWIDRSVGRTTAPASRAAL